MKNKGVVFGLIAGALTVGFYVVLYYFVDKNLVFNLWAYYFSFAFYLVAMYMASRQSALEAEGPFVWKDALRVAFLVFLVANAFFHISFYLLHLFDPQLADIQKELERDLLPTMFSPEKLPEEYQKLEERDFRISLGQTTLNWARGAILGFGLAGLIALITRKDKG